eukprot:scaffold79309_cov13-Tisochrysis_lutea.AAC.1
MHPAHPSSASLWTCVHQVAAGRISCVYAAAAHKKGRACMFMEKKQQPLLLMILGEARAENI